MINFTDHPYLKHLAIIYLFNKFIAGDPKWIENTSFWQICNSSCYCEPCRGVDMKEINVAYLRKYGMSIMKALEASLQASFRQEHNEDRDISVQFTYTSIECTTTVFPEMNVFLLPQPETEFFIINWIPTPLPSLTEFLGRFVSGHPHCESSSVAWQKLEWWGSRRITTRRAEVTK